MIVTANEIINCALKEVGYTSIDKSNKYNKWYYGKDIKADWCRVFVEWVFHECGAADMIPQHRADCTVNFYGYSKNKATMQPGDWVLFDWRTPDNIRDHIGIFYEWVVPGSTFKCIEGNTSCNGRFSYVKIRERSILDVHGHWMPPYKVDETPILKTAPAQFYDATLKGRWLVKSFEGLNMRTNAGTSYPIIKTLKDGDAVYCYGYYNVKNGYQWLCVMHEGRTGYVGKAYLRR